MFVEIKAQCSIVWFYGFKIHLIISDRGEILDFILTPGNVDGREPLKNMDLHKRIFGKLFGDKGYISKDLFEQLFIDGARLVTKLRENMINALMLSQDRIMLRKRALTESVNDELKNMCQTEHTRHRCFDYFIINMLSALAVLQSGNRHPGRSHHRLTGKQPFVMGIRHQPHQFRIHAYRKRCHLPWQPSRFLHQSKGWTLNIEYWTIRQLFSKRQLSLLNRQQDNQLYLPNNTLILLFPRTSS